MFFQETFDRAKAWVKELQRQGNPNVVIALAGNKLDLASQRKVSSEVQNFLSKLFVFHNRNQVLTESTRRHRVMQMKMEFCIWKHLQKQRQMSTSYLLPLV